MLLKNCFFNFFFVQNREQKTVFTFFKNKNVWQDVLKIVTESNLHGEDEE